MRCFFANHATPCDGQLIRGHLIPRQLLRREFPHGVILDKTGWRKLGRTEDRYDLEHRTLKDLIEDPRTWVPVCGGPSGIGGHHGMLDYARTLRVAREDLPLAVEEFAAEFGLTWWLEREYGPIARAA